MADLNIGGDAQYIRDGSGTYHPCADKKNRADLEALKKTVESNNTDVGDEIDALKAKDKEIDSEIDALKKKDTAFEAKDAELAKKDTELKSEIDTKVSKSGDTMSGTLTVNADVTAQNITATGRIEGDTVNAKHYELNNDPLVDSTGWADDYSSTLYVTASKGGLMTPTDKTKLDALASGALVYKKVDKLPDTGEKNTVYLVQREGGADKDACDEYLYDGTSFELIGSSKVDLTDYAKKSDLATKADQSALDEKANQTDLEALQGTVSSKASQSDVDTIKNDYLSKSKGGWVTAAVGIGTQGSAVDPLGAGSFINGNSCTASGDYSHAEGYQSHADYTAAHAEGYQCHADGIYAHAEGNGATASGQHSHAEGSQTTAKGLDSHAEGYNATAIGANSHAEGSQSTTTGDYSHAEGYLCNAEEDNSHAEGSHTTASGFGAHAEGDTCTASGAYSHAEGNNTTATGSHSHAEGSNTTAQGLDSHAEGSHTIATGTDQHVEGSYNKTEETDKDILFIIGCGSNEETRDNAFWVNHNGSIHSKGGLSSGGADYAEYFEWLDGNTDGEDRRGLFVTLDGDKVKIANSADDFILGVVSGAPTVIGNSYDCTWKDMYLKDVYGNHIKQEVTEEAHDDEDGTHHEARTYTTWVVNPEYDNEQEYIPREKRNEWVAIGMLGVLTVNDDGTCEVNGYCKVADGGTATKSDTGYRVLKRLDDTHVRILLK